MTVPVPNRPAPGILPVPRRGVLAWGCLLLALTGMAQVPRFEVSTEPPFPLPKDQAYTFGYLVVPEDRSAPGGSTVRLPVFILKSRNPAPAPDPVVYTAGGPGGSSLETARYGQYYSYLDDRDLIVFEQRGTRYAQPCLDCPELNRAMAEGVGRDVTEAQKLASLAQATRQCRERWVARGVRLEAYNTREIAADLEDLRRALGIRQWNLLTVSYSTKIAQTLLRDFPDGIRSVVMDSPLPLAVSYDEESTANWVASLDLLLARCGANSACRKAFPDLKRRFYQALQEADRQPIKLTVQPRDGGPVAVQLRGRDIASLISTSATEGLAGLPRLLDQVSRGEYEALKPALLDQLGGTSRALGMRLCVWCREALPFARRRVMTRETDRYPGLQGRSPAVFPAAVCEAWGVGRAGKADNRPVVSKVPVLLISGEYDADTPPAWATRMAAGFANGYHLVFEGMGHTPTQQWPDPCAMQVARAFFNNPRQSPVADCYRALPELRFTVKP